MKLSRIIAHWNVETYKPSELSKQHYHFIYDGNGREIIGNCSPEANINVADGYYAKHTLGCNEGSIGVACSAMFGAVSETKYGKYPIKAIQFDSMCAGIARLCIKYGIAVTKKTVLTHAEVQGTLGIKQRGKWDIAVLPHAGFRGATPCGNFMRSKVQEYINKM